MLGRLISRDTQIKIATGICGLAVCLSGIGVISLAPALLVPFLGLLALPILIICLAVLLFTIPALVYLLLAQDGAPTFGLFLPLNPMRDLGIIKATLSYIFFCADIVPAVLWNMARYLVWERMLVKAGEINMGSRDIGELWDGFAVFGLSYTPQLKLDIYLPPVTTITRPRAPDNDPGSGVEWTLSPASSHRSTALLTISDPLIRPPSHSLSSSTSSPTSQPSFHSGSPPAMSSHSHSISSSKSDARGKPVIIFIYDPASLGPIRPRRWFFSLLGAKLASMGYVLVIPDVPTYPHGDARAMVEGLRRALSWVNDNINGYHGDPTQIHLLGHGLGAHLALYTLAQQNIIISLRKSDARRKTPLRIPLSSSTSSRSPYPSSAITRPPRTSYSDGFSYFSPEAPMVSSLTPTKRRRLRARAPGLGLSARGVGQGDEAELEGLREMGTYGEEIEIPRVKGVILLSPVTDVIKQIKHESTAYLEHISPLRRTLGPSQAMCMRHSLGHLLFAGKGVLDARRMPKVMIIHGAQDTITPLDHGHWLHELLHGLDVDTVFRPYRNLDHWGGVLGLMARSRGEYTDWLEKDVRSFVGPA